MGTRHVFLILIPCFVSLVWAAFECQKHSDCDPSKCCSKIPRIMAVSKRSDGPLPVPMDWIVSSSCKPYLQENTTCVNVITVNGDCGCAPGTHCKYFKDADTLPFHHLPKRGVYPGSPASFRCARD